MKTSLTLSREVVRGIDRVAGKKRSLVGNGYRKTADRKGGGPRSLLANLRGAAIGVNKVVGIHGQT